MNTLTSGITAAVVEELFQAAEQARSRSVTRSINAALAGASAAERADALAGSYMPVSPEGCRLFYSLVRAIRPQTV